MNKSILALFLFFSASFKIIIAQSDERKDADHKFSLSAYGEMLYQHFDYGPNQKASTQGSLKTNRAIIDIPKFVFEMKYKFLLDLYVESEIEFEHLGTGSALELEYEEFGEYEFESEKGGEVELEEFFINKSFSKSFNIRVGRFPIPITLLNKKHEPDDYFRTVRPESEIAMLPSTWSETGLEFYGNIFDFDYRVAVVNGLDASGFSSERWIGEGYQTKFEEVKATNLATITRLDYKGIKNLLVGGSVYYGNSTGNRPKPEDMEGIDGYVTLLDFHYEFLNNPLILRGDYIYGNLENSDIISQRNARLSVNTQNPRSPVAKNALAWYNEIGYNIAPLLSVQSDLDFYPFLRYEYYNTMQKVEPGIFANPRFKRSVLSFGINLIWNDELVLKLDYSSRKVGGGTYNTENTIGIGIGFNTTFIKGEKDYE
jgi:hypothetical protein